MNILADATLPGLNEAFPEPFKLSVYRSQDEIPSLLNSQDILLCRSTLKITQTLIGNSTLSVIATASSGTDHIDTDYLNSKKITLIDAKGSNARAVLEYVLASLAYVKKFGFINNKAGIIGLGAVGTLVAESLKRLDFSITVYDPLKFPSNRPSLKEVIECGLICIHANLHDKQPYPSKNLLNTLFFSQLQKGTVIINAARGGIVNEEALLNYINSIHYCTDVYLGEPEVNKEIINKSKLCTPHIAGHTIEAKIRAVYMISEKLHSAYGLISPNLVTPKAKVIEAYDPLPETLALKKAIDLKQAFLNLRKAHTRHE
jgi:erythronate-4-phosphate dehydrogenase